MTTPSSNRPEDSLFDAARRGDVAHLNELVSTGLDVNVQDGKGFTPLVIAAYDGQLEAVQALLTAHANPNTKDVAGNTALMGVSFKGHEEVARLLLRQGGADINAQNGTGSTALMFAAMFGRDNLVRLLLDEGADTTLRDAQGLSAHDLAVRKGNKTTLQLFQEYGVQG